MNGGFRGKSNITHLLRFHTTTVVKDPTTTTRATVILRNQTQQPSRPYFRLPHFFKKAKDSEVATCLISTPSQVFNVGFVGWYLGMVKCRPVLTKSVTSSLIYTAADLSAQAFNFFQTISLASLEPYDFMRTLRMAGYGMLVVGPTLHFWFNFMSKLSPKKDLLSTLKKMVMGQTIYGPSITVVFFSLNAFLQGENGSEIVTRLKRDLLPTMINGIMYWPVCDFITFRFIPVHMQPLVSNSFSYLWTIYMTYMASLEKASISSS